MATNWPSSVQTFTNPTSGSSLSSPSHSDQHATVNDTVEALQNYAGMVFVKSVTVGSGVSSVTVTNAFSSTYKNYRVILSAMAGSSLQNLFVTVGGVTVGYFGSSVRSLMTSSTLAVVNKYNASEFYAGEVSTTGNAYYEMTFYQPYETVTTKFDARSFGGGYFTNFGGINNQTGSYTSFTLAPSSGTLTGGTIRVYGYNNGA